MAGAEVIANLSASDDITGKYAYLSNLVAQQSARCICGYVYASAGFGESSTDLVFDAKLFIAENGRMLSQNKRWQSGVQMTVSDIDIEALRRDRMHNGSFEGCRRNNRIEITEITTGCTAVGNCGAMLTLILSYRPTTQSLPTAARKSSIYRLPLWQNASTPLIAARLS